MNKNITHGHARRGAHTGTYQVWVGMRNRCIYPTVINYKHYGGRGIKVCEAWTKFENFLADMGVRPVGHTLDRRDVNGDYEPSNCEWVLKRKQELNKRNIVFLEYDEKRLCLSEWSRKLGIDRRLLTDRLKLGWSVERTLSTPVRRIKREL